MMATAPATQTMAVSEAGGQFPVLVERVARARTRIVVEERGAPVAALISIDDLKRLERLDRERAERFAIIDELRAAFAGVPEEEILREVDRILDVDSDENPRSTRQASR